MLPPMEPSADDALPRTASSITEAVVQRLEDLVLTELEPGAELPSEADLAAQFDVSRLTVREAARSLQARGLVETRHGRRAAGQAGRSAVSAMELALAAMREAADDPVALHETDISFHASLAAGAGNQLLSFLIEAMEEPLRASRMRSMRGHLARGGTVEDVIEQHARILDRVKARDAAGAATAMLAHLEQTARDLRAAFRLTGLRLDPEPAGQPGREATA